MSTRSSSIFSRPWFDWSFMAVGLSVQVVTFLLMPHDSWLSLLSGCLGVCSVCLTAQGNILTYFFGFAQVFTYTYLCLRAHLYGEVAINAYYFLTMIYGVYVWRRRLRPEDKRLQTRQLSCRIWGVMFLLVCALSALAGWLLSRYSDDPTPYLDGFTTVASLAAQLLMIFAYRDQWFLWFAVDITSVVMWLYVGDYCMTAQYAFWCCNCVYGYLKWRKLEV